MGLNRSSILFIGTIMLGVFLLVAAAYGVKQRKGENVLGIENEEKESSEGVMVGGKLMTPEQDILTNLMGADNLTYLTRLANDFGPIPDTSNLGPFTVFVPNDQAFDTVEQTLVNELMQPEGRQRAINIMSYHVVPEALTLNEISDGAMLSTLLGEQIRITKIDGKVFVNDAEVVNRDIVSSNGVAHIINQVLIPAP